MTDIDVKRAIQSALQSFSDGALTGNALRFFQTLGYNTDRQSSLPEKTFSGFKDAFPVDASPFNPEKALYKEWQSVDLLFQLTAEELSGQMTLFSTGKAKWQGEDKESVIETYLFFALELAKPEYPRSALARITREINKIFSMPVMLLIKHGDYLTFSVINRRLHKKDDRKDVLEKVTLIKDISIASPHRAHIEILFDLSLKELRNNYKIDNFLDLHNAWRKTLDTKELNKRFYRDLSNWYFWAIDRVSFPNDIDDDKDDTIFNSENMIRLLTRLIFVWFIKEKNLVPEHFFDENALRGLIKGFNEEGSTVYYRAILQNLFFATLNQKAEERTFATDGTFTQNKKNYGIKNLYRYAGDFSISKEAVIELFKTVPFLNGGLFDCLDTENKNGKVLYIDGFSRNPKKQARVLDDLFFSKEKNADLSNIYGDKKKKKETVKGLFEIFKHYKFTITENTPIEEEVALDPELLGQVFENLLASYNPETKTTARKQTGSFYTPREIVDFMVDESLNAYLSEELKDEAGMSPDDAEVGLDLLIGYNEKDHLFDEKETDVLIKAIDSCKILDPACGSGAFPMGILHKLVHILHKLDPKNQRWKERQIEKVDHLIQGADKISDSAFRDKIITDLEASKRDIEDSFANNELDYGRKLFLIENCIYGVDIQPIAIQISKLRFFISLVVDQKGNQTKDNFGIRPLPNLEIKFVAADTLIGIDQPEGNSHWSDDLEVQALQQQLKDIRHKVFSAKTPGDKKTLRQKDEETREKLSAKLESLMNEEMANAISNSKETKEILYFRKMIQKNGAKPEYLNEIETRENILNQKTHDFQSKNHETARRLAAWDPYNQNTAGTFFDPEWMFGVRDGLDLVIGNPPYIQLQKDGGKLANRYKSCGYKTFERTGDIYALFYENGVNLLAPGGHLCFITSNKWMRGGYGKGLRKFFASHDPVLLVDLGPGIFENAIVDTNILIINKGDNKGNLSAVTLNSDAQDAGLSEFIKQNKNRLPEMGEDVWLIGNQTEQNLKGKIERLGKPLKKWDVNIYYGIKTGLNEAFIIDTQTKERICKEDPKSEEIIKPILRGRDIKRYGYAWAGFWLITSGFDIDIPKKYPLIYNHLQRFEEKAKRRDDQGKNWWNLRACAYYPEFEKEKVVWGNLALKSQMAIVPKGFYINAPSPIITNANNYILGLLNSKTGDYYIRLLGVTRNGGYFEYKPVFVEQLPIPPITPANQDVVDRVEHLVDSILAAKKQNPSAVTSLLEQEIDRLVYGLYGLTDAEIAIVEKKE